MLPTNERLCLQTAIKLLAGRDHSELELRRRLASKDFDTDIIDKVIENLLSRRYLDDVTLCTTIFNKYLATGKYGLNAVVARLKQRQFSSSVIQAIVKDYDQSQGLQAASVLVTRRFAHASPEDAPKIARFLTARGFSPGIVINVLESLRLTDDN